MNKEEELPGVGSRSFGGTAGAYCAGGYGGRAGYLGFSVAFVPVCGSRAVSFAECKVWMDFKSAVCGSDSLFIHVASPVVYL